MAIAAALLFTLVVFKQAWISDDALLIARTVANWLAGYGPYVNIGEAAQAFTSPLWFVMTAGASWIARDILVTLIAMGVLTAGFAVYFLARDLKHWWQAVLLMIPLMSSFAIMDFTTGGLENPLLFLLIVIAWHQARRQRLVSSVLAMGLLVLTRFDMAFLAMPAVAFVAREVWRRDRKRLPHLIFAAFTPLVGWFAFSLVTYGSIFAETAPAKLNLLIPRRELLSQGVGYLVESFHGDWVTLGLVIFAAAGFFFRSVTGFSKSLVLGAFFYLLYVVWVGGDFMIGRFVFVPAVVGLVVLAEVLSGKAHDLLQEHVTASATPTNPGRVTSVLTAVALLGAVLLFQGGLHPVTEHPIRTATRWSSADPLHLGIADERRVYVQGGYSLWNWLLMEPYENKFAVLRSALRDWPSGREVDEVRIKCGGFGTASILAGPQVHFVDPCGKADPFLARRPFEANKGRWRIGHFWREIPEGYIEALVSGDARLLDDSHRDAFTEISLARRVDSRWPDDPALVEIP